MSRLRRLETTGKIFFVTCNVAKSVKPLSAAERDLLLIIIGETRQRLHFRLFAYVVMPSHWHALILPAQGQTISAVMHAIKRNSALQINSHRGKTGSLWQARFFDRFLRRVADFHEAVTYIHTNPVRDSFTSELVSWPWSSYGNFVGARGSSLTVDRIELPADESQRI